MQNRSRWWGRGDRAVRRRIGSVGAATLASLLCALTACAQDNRSARPAVTSGIAQDANTGEPIAQAWIFEAVPAGTSGADVRRIVKARIRRTDRDGRFSFEPAAKGFSLGGQRAARYHFYHPSYGLVRGREASAAPIRFTPSLRDAHLRQADAQSLCASARSANADAMTSKIAELACPPARPDQFASGQPRARGELDAQGRRNGHWVFLRENGSVIAEGDYQSGAAVGDWTFNSPN